ncbi:MAG TPA: MauE/DoxX family redox-associated membrane protein [Actinomycetota bacterium]|nr:MauE/DoxX family redox-associated membrane protein [Actinomycetota bacterium]
MVETITPVVYGGRARWAGGLALHVVGATLAAAAFGALAGWVGGLVGAPFGASGLVALGAAAIVYAGAAAEAWVAPVPQLRRQVPDWWRTFFSPPVTAFLYGAGLGIGFLTFLATGALAVVTLAAVLSGSAAAGAVLAGGFGLARGLSALPAIRVRDAEDGRQLVDRLSERGDGLRRVGVAVTLGVVAVAAFASVPVAARGGAAGLAAAIVAAAFAWAAVAKRTAARRWGRTLAAHDLPPWLASRARVGVPAAEALVPALALLGLTRLACVWAGVLLVAVTAAVVRGARRHGGQVACGCFGARRERPLGQILARNAGLLALAAFGAAGTVDAPAWPGPPAAGDWLPMTLAIGGLLAVAIASWQVAAAIGRGRT